MNTSKLKSRGLKQNRDTTSAAVEDRAPKSTRRLKWPGVLAVLLVPIPLTVARIGLEAEWANVDVELIAPAMGLAVGAIWPAETANRYFRLGVAFAVMQIASFIVVGLANADYVEPAGDAALYALVALCIEVLGLSVLFLLTSVVGRWLRRGSSTDSFGIGVARRISRFGFTRLTESEIDRLSKVINVVVPILTFLLALVTAYLTYAAGTVVPRP